MANCYCLFPIHRSDVTVSQSIYISYLEQRGQSQTVCFCAATACIGQMTARDRDPGQHTWILDSGMPVCWASFSLVAIPGNRFFSKASIRISVWNLEKCVRLLPASLTTEHIGTQQGLQVSFHIQTWKKKATFWILFWLLLLLEYAPPYTTKELFNLSCPWDETPEVTDIASPNSNRNKEREVFLAKRPFL